VAEQALFSGVPGIAAEALQEENVPWNEQAGHAAGGTSAAGNHLVGTNDESKASGECVVKDSKAISERYLESCRNEFWQKVFQLELEYLVQHMQGCRDVLSVGCGPAIMEGGLAERGFNVTGLDVSHEALNCAPDQVRTVASRAEDMSFPESSFDAVIYVASLQFVEDYRKALEKSAAVLRPNGKILAMLLNPQSEFFKSRSRDSGSYVSKIRHTDLKAMEDVIAERFSARTEYFLGVKDHEVFESADAANAALYIILEEKRAWA
jgi:ubiquinone/menaquinone biosynthesis C-methylase UbiE